MPRTSAARHRVVIVGSGFGGLFAAKSLGRAPDIIETTLIGRTNHHLFQPLLYQVATGILSEGQIAPATRDVLKKKKNVSVELAEVTGFDLKARHVTAVQPSGRKVTLSYHSLIVAAGVGQSYFGHDEYAEWAPGMKTLADALDQRARILGAFEMAELEDDPDVRRAWLTFVIVGAGPTGVEIAGQIAELSRRALKHDFRRFDPGEVRVLLFEGGSRDPGHFRRQALRESDARAGEDRHQNSREFDCYAHRRGRGRCQGARRVRAALCGEDEDLGCRCLGIASGEVAGGRHRRAMRSGRPHQSATGLLTARSPGGVRSRRHDELQRPPGRCGGCPPVRPACCSRH